MPSNKWWAGPMPIYLLLKQKLHSKPNLVSVITFRIMITPSTI